MERTSPEEKLCAGPPPEGKNKACVFSPKPPCSLCSIRQLPGPLQPHHDNLILRKGRLNLWARQRCLRRLPRARKAGSVLESDRDAVGKGSLFSQEIEQEALVCHEVCHLLTSSAIDLIAFMEREQGRECYSRCLRGHGESV